MMKKSEDQAAFYHLLAKLLWYLASGKSHVGYLCNCPRNPFVAKSVFIPIFFSYFVDDKPRVIHGCIVVQSSKEISSDLEDDFIESDMMIDSNENDKLEERMEEMIIYK
jgi:hypothetical protein